MPKNSKYNIGIDLGNGYTNFFSQASGEGCRFETKMKSVSSFPYGTNQRSDIRWVEFGTEKFIVGEGTSLPVQDVKERINNQGYKIALLTAIASALPRSGYAEVNLTVGLPISRIELFGSELKAIISGWGATEFMMDGNRYEIKISNVTVFPEGALSMLMDLRDGRVLTIDMGSGTVDCVEFTYGQPGVTHTVQSSMRNIYSDVVERLNKKHGMSVNTDSVEKYIGKNVIWYDRKDLDISEHLQDIELGVKRIIGEIEAKFGELKEYDRIILMGGGAILTQSYWEASINGIELKDNAQYANAEIFQKVAEQVGRTA